MTAELRRAVVRSANWWQRTLVGTEFCAIKQRSKTSRLGDEGGRQLRVARLPVGPRDIVCSTPESSHARHREISSAGRAA